MYSGIYESMSLSRQLGIRPLCPCCSGGKRRQGYSCTKAASHHQNIKARRSKPKYKNKRDGINGT